MASSPQVDQSALEEVRATLLEIAQEGLRARPEGIFLTYMGSEFVRRKNAPFEQYMTVLAVQRGLTVPVSARKMIPFIKIYCADVFELEHTSSGADLVRLKEGAPPQDDPSDPAPNHKYKRAVWAAFIRPLEADHKRFLNMDTLGFTDAKRKPAGGIWLEIKSEFITPTPIEDEIDSPLVQSRIGGWANANGVDIEVLLDFKRVSSATVGDLVRIIRSLPERITTNWLIPADVLRHLKGSD